MNRQVSQATIIRPDPSFLTSIERCVGSTNRLAVGQEKGGWGGKGESGTDNQKES